MKTSLPTVLAGVLSLLLAGTAAAGFPTHAEADGDRDGIPNVLVEALAMGVPAVATRVSSIPEIVIEGETGLTVDQEDSEALSVAVIKP